MAFHLFLHQQGQTDLCIRTAENPKATRQFHPLTMNIMERPKVQGGLGMVKATLSYCQTTTSPYQAFQKDTNLWADYAGILELFVDSTGMHVARTCHSVMLQLLSLPPSLSSPHLSLSTLHTLSTGFTCSQTE